jgi:DNA-binding IscR family transcriptional regulator
MTGYDIDNHLFDLVNSEQITINGYAVGHYIKKIQNLKKVHVFTIMISSMATTLGISRQVASKYFHELVAVGFVKVVEITAKKGIRICLDVNDDVINDVNDDVKNINTTVNTLKKKERKTKKEEDIIIKPKLEKLNLPKSTMQPFEKIEIANMGDYLSEQIATNYYLLKQATSYDLEKLNRSIQPFILHQQLQQTPYIHRSDVYKHFARWIRTFDVDREQPNQPTKKAGEMTADEIAKWVSNQIHKKHDN